MEVIQAIDIFLLNFDMVMTDMGINLLLGFLGL